MDSVTTKDLASILSGGDSYIRTKNNIVKGLAITTKKNPEAPEIIVVGKGKRIIASAKLFLKQDDYVPVYLKQTVNTWKYIGHYKAKKYTKDPKIIEKHRKHRSRDNVDGILFLVSSDKTIVNISTRLVPNQKTKNIIEQAAVKFVINYYKKLGFTVTDHQNANLGYDILVESKKETFKIEIKGTSNNQPRFFITRNERLMSADPLWKIAIVSNVLTKPELLIYNSKEMETIFNFDALCWECKKIDTK